MHRLPGRVQKAIPLALSLALFPGAWLLTLALMNVQGWTFLAVLTWSGAVGFVTALLAGAAYVAGRTDSEMRRTSTALIVLVWPLVALCTLPITLAAAFVTSSF